MLLKLCIYCWNLFFRLKVPFLLIFSSMNYIFLNKYGTQNMIPLITAFTIQNFGLHMFNNYFDLKEDEASGQAKVAGNKMLLLTLSVLSTLISLLIVIFYKFSITCYIILFVLMFLYSFPLFSGLRIKNILYLKNITGSLFWWYLPFTLIASLHTTAPFTEIFLSNLFVLATFMPFEPLWDIKDMDGDLKAGIKTIPNQYGVKATKLLVGSCFILLGIIKLSGSGFAAFTLFAPLAAFTLLINEKTPLYAYHLMMLFLPLHIIVSLLLG